MGILKCDDGNLLEDDGCSPLCNVEEGFKCEGGNATHKDICTEIIPPYIKGFKQPNTTSLQIIFVEPVLFKGNLGSYIYIYI